MFSLFKTLLIPLLLFLQPTRKRSVLLEISTKKEQAPSSLNQPLKRRKLLSELPNFITELKFDLTEAYQPVDLVHTFRLENGYFLTTQKCVRRDDMSGRNLTCLVARDEGAEQVVYQGVYGREAATTSYEPIKSVQAPDSTVITIANIQEGGVSAGAIFFGSSPEDGQLYFSQRLDSGSDQLTDIIVTAEALYLVGNNGTDQQLRKVRYSNLAPLYSYQYPTTGRSEMGRGAYYDTIADRILITGEGSNTCRDNDGAFNRHGTIIAINPSNGLLATPIFQLSDSKRVRCLSTIRFNNSYALVWRRYRYCDDRADSPVFVRVIRINLDLTARLSGYGFFDWPENEVHLSVANNTLCLVSNRHFASPGRTSPVQRVRVYRFERDRWVGYDFSFPTLSRPNLKLVTSETDATGKSAISFVDETDRRQGVTMYVNHFEDENFIYCGDLSSPDEWSDGIRGNVQVGSLVAPFSIIPFLTNNAFLQLSDRYGVYGQLSCGPTRNPTKSPTRITRPPIPQPTPVTALPTAVTELPTNAPSAAPSQAPTAAPVTGYQRYTTYKRSIEGVDIIHDLAFLEGRAPLVFVENEEAGLWYSLSDESGQLLKAARIDVEATIKLHPLGISPNSEGGEGSNLAFSGEHAASSERRSLHLLVLSRSGSMIATARLLGQEVAGYAQLLSHNSSYAIWNGRFRRGRSEEYLLLGYYDLAPIRGRPRYTAWKSLHYNNLWNRGIKKGKGSTYYGVTTVLRTAGGRSVLWYYRFTAPPFQMGRTRYLASSQHNLHATAFTVTDENSLWTLHVPIGEQPTSAIIAEITSTHRKGQIYLLRAPAPYSIYMTGLAVMRDNFDQKDQQLNIFIAGYTNQIPLLGGRALCLARYNNRFQKQWAFAYNSSILVRRELFLKPYEEGLYLSGSSDIGIFELLINASNGQLSQHKAYPIDLLLSNYTDNLTFYFAGSPLPAFTPIDARFQNYTVTLRQKGDFSAPLLNQLNRRSARKAKKKSSPLNDPQFLFISTAATFGACLLIGIMYVVIQYMRKEKKRKQEHIINRVTSQSSHTNGDIELSTPEHSVMLDLNEDQLS